MAFLPRFGAYIPQYVNFDLAKSFAQRAEKLGFHSLWVNDHLAAPFGDVSDIQLDGWTLLSSLASITSKVRLGTLVICNPLRHPAVLAKMAATLDNISGGRLDFGIGAGWKMEDFKMIGSSPQLGAIKLAQLEEAIQIILKLWSQDNVIFTGNYYKLEKGYCAPKPLQKPHPLILLGVGTGRTGIRLIAHYADKCNFTRITPDEYRRKLDEATSESRSMGRRTKIKSTISLNIAIKLRADEYEGQLQQMAKLYNQSVKEFMQRYNLITGTPEECAASLMKYSTMPIDEFILFFPENNFEKQMECFMNIIAPCLM